MRSRLLAMTAVALLMIVPAANAGQRVPKTPTRGVRVTTSGSTVRYTVNRAGKPRTPGRVRVSPGSVTCRRWTTIETVGSGPPEKPVTTTITHYWKQCFSTATGRPTGPAREYHPGGGGAPPAEEVWTAVVPDPVIQRENGVRFVTQRTAWVWLPPEYFRGITVDLRSSTGELGDRFDAIIASSGLAARKPKPKLIGAGAGIVVVGGLIGALMFGSGRDSQQVIVASHPIDAGTVLTAADVKGVSVSGPIGFRATRIANLAALVGKVAAVPIPAGTLIVAEQLQLRQSAPAGTVLVGMVLDPGALPSPDLRFGDHVQVLATSNPNAVIDEPAAVMTDATVWKVWGGTEGSGRRTVTLAVPSGVATQVGDAASRNLIRLLVVPTDQSGDTR